MSIISIKHKLGQSVNEVWPETNYFGSWGGFIPSSNNESLTCALHETEGTHDCIRLSQRQ